LAYLVHEALAEIFTPMKGAAFHLKVLSNRIRCIAARCAAPYDTAYEVKKLDIDHGYHRNVPSSIRRKDLIDHLRSYFTDPGNLVKISLAHS